MGEASGEMGLNVSLPIAINTQGRSHIPQQVTPDREPYARECGTRESYSRFKEFRLTDHPPHNCNALS